jgi:CDP-paratose 2-epimerase
MFDSERPVLITGGAGFIGVNLADRLLNSGQPVLVFDNLSRPGSVDNLRWLRRQHGSGLDVVVADVRDRAAVKAAVAKVCRVFHLAAQVAVTTSLLDPREDFDVNAGGTLTVLDAIRASLSQPPLLYTSTNKVYGTLRAVPLTEGDGDKVGYGPADPHLRACGIDEDQPLDFHSPYGCSKGCADQYVLDHARVYGLQAVVFRMSCIYGPHQNGNEDQGWVAHFLLRALAGGPITIYGNGRQVRDLLFVEDLVNAMLRAQSTIGALSGQAFNIGGGVENAVSLRGVLATIERQLGRRLVIEPAGWRAGDQRYFVADTGRFRHATGWRAKVGVEEGIDRLLAALRETTASARILPDEGGAPLELGAS